MKVLIACEFSGVVRNAFLSKGHDAWSCDLLPTEQPPEDRHIVSDVRGIIDNSWDLMVAFPPCTYICRSGIHWNRRIPGRQQLSEKALEFVHFLLNCPIEKVALENPIGLINSRIRKPDQIIQPYHFGEDASKKTCLWLKNLPKLKATVLVLKRLYSNQTTSGQNITERYKGRAKDRSRTYQGIANAMAEQWGEPTKRTEPTE